jgi:hypothetical protein
MGGVTFNRFDKVRDEIVAALELHIDIRPCIIALNIQANETVVQPDEEKD